MAAIVKSTQKKSFRTINILPNATFSIHPPFMSQSNSLCEVQKMAVSERDTIEILWAMRPHPVHHIDPLGGSGGGTGGRIGC